MGKEESIVPTLVALIVVCLIEAIIGFTHHNGYIIRDFLLSAIMIASIMISQRALQLSRKKRNHEYNFGYRRMNILAAFVNMVYILVMGVFGALETVEHMIEHW